MAKPTSTPPATYGLEYIAGRPEFPSLLCKLARTRGAVPYGTDWIFALAPAVWGCFYYARFFMGRRVSGETTVHKSTMHTPHTMALGIIYPAL